MSSTPDLRILSDREFRLARKLAETLLDTDISGVFVGALDEFYEQVKEAREVLRLAALDHRDNWASTRDAARLMGCSVSRVRRMIAGGELPAKRNGRAIRVPVSAIHEYNEMTTTIASPPARRERRSQRSLDDQQVISNNAWLDRL
jgi:excisionase family DNA binding protein